MEKFETFLPVFKGTYGNYWDDYCPKDEDGHDLPIDRYEINQRALLESIGKSMISWFEHDTDLFGLAGIESIEFEGSHSPQFYNFSNDSINVSITINTDKLYEYILENKEYFTKEIQYEFTSRSGFIPYYSNDIDDWEKETQGFTDFSCNQFYLGFLLNIICDIEGYEERDAYWDWCDLANEDNFATIRPLEWEDIDVNEAFLEKQEEFDWSFGYMSIIKADAVKKSELFNTDWRDEIGEDEKIDILENLNYSPKDFY